MRNKEIQELAPLLHQMTRTLRLIYFSLKFIKIIEAIAKFLSLFLTAHLTVAYLIIVTPIILSFGIIEAMVHCACGAINTQTRWYEKNRNFIYRKVQARMHRTLEMQVQVADLRLERKTLKKNRHEKRVIN